MYQYILFDLDGTLTDPKTGICRSVAYALEDVGICVGSLDELEPFIGPPLKDSFMEYYHMSEVEAEAAIQKYRERFSVTGLYENEIYPGIKELLDKLTKAGKHLAIASSKPTVFVEKILKHFEIYDYFQIVIGSELDGRRGKKEEVVKEALFQLLDGEKARCSECVMVGDRKFDIEGAKAFGLDSIGVTYGYGGNDELAAAGATYLAEKVADLEKILLPPDGKIKRFKHLVTAMFSCISPVILYWLVTTTVILFSTVIMQQNGIPERAQQSVWLNAFGSLVAIPVIWKLFPEKYLTERLGRSQKKLRYLLLVILGGSSAIFLNMLLSYVRLSELLPFPGHLVDYDSVARVQYSVSWLEGILIYGLIMPFAEELLFRGVVFTRMKTYWKSIIAIPASALLFGFYHGNLEQALYGFCMGCIMAYFFWLSNDLLEAVVLHAAANCIVFTITFNKNVEMHFNQPLNCFIFVTISIATWYCLSKTEIS